MPGQYKTIICLVGENPLPVYLGIQQFAEQDAQIILVHSTGTEDTATAIAKKIKQDSRRMKKGWVCIPQPPLANAFDPAEVQRILSKLKHDYPNAALNYTGGTKVMSSFAVREWKSSLSNVFYLEETEGLFRFGDGTIGNEEGIFAFDISVNDLCELHNVTLVRSDKQPELTLNDIKSIWTAWKRGERYPDTDNHNFNWLKANQNEWKRFVSILSPSTQSSLKPFPETASDFWNGNFKTLQEIAATRWLEHLAKHQVEALYPDQTYICSQDFNINHQPFESDGMIVRSNRLYYLSATTSTREKYVKAKMFEAVYRARQIGGGLARSCVVSLANDITCANSRASMGNDARHTFFGCKDVEGWLNEDRETLEDFLNA